MVSIIRVFLFAVVLFVLLYLFENDFVNENPAASFNLIFSHFF